MNVLGLDLSTSRTGWAVLDDDREIVAYGAITTDRYCKTSEDRYIYVLKQTKRLLTKYNPVLVVCEEPHLQFKSAGTVLNRLYGAVFCLCYLHPVGCTSVPVSTLKQIATNHGNASKQDMVDAANHIWKLNLTIKQNDEADALFVASHAVDLLNDSRQQ